MNQSTISQAISDYKQALELWLQGDSSLESVLSVFRSRDIIHAALKDNPTPEVALLKEIKTLDDQLRRQASQMSEQLDFEDFRKSLLITQDQWWWSLKKTEIVHPLDQYDWLFNALSLGAWTFSLALLTDISRRFLLGGAGIGGLSFVTLSNLLAFLKARSDLTQSGKKTKSEQNNKILLLSIIKIPSYWHSEIKCISTLLLTWFFLICWLSLPSISDRYNNQGVEDQSNNKFGTAVKNYIRAIELNQENKTAHYNLGTVYEDMRKFDLAKQQYAIAVDGKEVRAFSSLARLNIFDGTDESIEQAIALLQEGIQYVPEEDLATKFSFYKNLGWARFKQGYFDEAEDMLQAAIRIEEELNKQTTKEQAYTSGSAHCLLAETLEAKGSSDTTEIWKRCCQLADSTKLGEDAWLFEARTKLKEKGINPQESLCKSINLPTF